MRYTTFWYTNYVYLTLYLISLPFMLFIVNSQTNQRNIQNNHVPL